ncbi:MAG TPA: hypothetical protein VGM87_11395 [Roseomonas sp.]
MSIRGSIDDLTTSGASGWLFAGRQDAPPVVQAMMNGTIIGEAVADQERADLAAAGLGDGRCGFSIAFYQDVSAQLLPTVRVSPQGSDLELPRTNLTGFTDFLSAMRARFPAAGWTGSVFGGLWTDRSDAAQVLAGRIATGATPADLETPLSRLIADGYLLLTGLHGRGGFLAADIGAASDIPEAVPLQPRLGEGADRLIRAIPDALFGETPLRLMRAVLDDNPSVYRVSVQRRDGDAFLQASAFEVLPSPTECLLAMAAIGGPVLVDLVRHSHRFPEFTTDGRSRWLPDGDAPATIAVAQGASVQTITLRPGDLMLLGPGTIFRLRPGAGDATALLAWSAPARQTPVRFLTGRGGSFTLQHFSGASLTV